MVNRISGSGVGIALIAKKALKSKLLHVQKVSYSETVTTKSGKCHVMGVYRPPQTSISCFTDEIVDLTTNYLCEYQNLVVMGDFNIHIPDYTSNDVIQFNKTMEAVALVQHEYQPTHHQGNNLDLVFSLITAKISISEVMTGPYVSDRASVLVYFNVKKNTAVTQKVVKRCMKDVTAKAILAKLELNNYDTKQSLSEAHHQLNTELLRVMDKITPIEEKTTYN